jgi:hypothetical protein
MNFNEICSFVGFNIRANHRGRCIYFDFLVMRYWRHIGPSYGRLGAHNVRAYGGDVVALFDDVLRTEIGKEEKEN